MMDFKLSFLLIFFVGLNSLSKVRSYDENIDILKEIISNIFSQKTNETGSNSIKEWDTLENTFVLSPKCENAHLSKDFKNYLKVERSSPLKNQLLKEFLCMKFFQYYDLISYLSIEEYRESLIQFKILKFIQTSKNIGHQRTDSCSIEHVANENINGIVSICPWYWRAFIRDDKYPYEISAATCNCLNCQARTVFDSDIFKLSKCNLVYRLSPVLVKETDMVGLEENYEAWFFNLEEIPVSCTCDLKIDPY